MFPSILNAGDALRATAYAIPKRPTAAAPVAPGMAPGRAGRAGAARTELRPLRALIARSVLVLAGFLALVGWLTH